MRRHRPTRLVLLAVAAVVAVTAAAGAAWAYWSTSGTGTASATTATFAPPDSVTATSAAGTGTVTVGWSAASLSTGAGPTGYTVSRVGADGTSPACGSPVTGTGCTDTGVPAGSYRYQVTALYRTWTATSGLSQPVTVTAPRPSVTVEQAAGQADPTNAASIAFTATFSEPVVDFGSGAVSSGGTAPGSRTVQVAGSGSSYTVTIGGLTGGGTVTASIAADAVHDSAGTGNAASTSVDNTVTYDPVAPGAATPAVTAAVSYGNAPLYVSSEPVTFTDSATDADSGVRSVSYYRCPGLTGSCTGGTLIGTSATAAGNYPVTSATPLGPDGPYQVVAIVTDNAGNTATSAALQLAVDSTPPTASRPTVNGHA